MHIEFTISRTEEYFRARLKPPARRKVQPLLGVGYALGVVGAVIAVCSEAAPLGLLIGGGFGLATAACLLIARQWYRAMLTVPEAWLAPRHYVVTEERVSATSGSDSTTWTLPEIRMVGVRPEAFLLWGSGPEVLDIPREPLSAQQEDELLTVLERHRLLPAGKTGVPRANQP